MKKILKGRLSLALAMIMVFSLAACGNSGNGAARDKYVYVAEYITLPIDEGENVYSEPFQLVGNKLYYLVRNYDREKGMRTDNLYALDILDKEAQPIELAIDNAITGNMMKLAVDGEGNLHIASRGYEIDEETGFPQNEYYLLSGYRADGTELYKSDISSYLTGNDYMYIQHMAIDKQNNIFLTNGESIILAFDKEGNFLFDLPISGGWINAFGSGKSGDVYLARYGMGEVELTSIDVAGRQLGTTYRGLPRDTGNMLLAGTEKELMFSNSYGIVEYDTKTQTYETILNYLDSDINSNNIRLVSVLEDGRIFIYSEGDGYGSSNSISTNAEIMLLTKTDSSAIPQKEILTFGTFNLDYNIRAQIIDFNKKSNEYRIEVIDYAQDVDWTSDTGYEDALTRMRNEITSKNAPDMISFSWGIDDFSLFTSKGIVEDLSPYLERSTVLDRDDMVSSVLEAYTSNGVLCGIPPTFNINTMFAKSSLVGDEMGWTLDELLKAMEKMPENAQVMQYGTKESILQACIIYSMSDFIDWETGKCNFNNDEFIKILEFANTFPDDYSYDQDAPSFVELVRENKLLLYQQSLSNSRDYQVMSMAFGEPVTSIGFPSSSGKGITVNAQSVIGISAKSKHKEAAWSFLESLIKGTATSERYSWGFSIFISEINKKFEEEMTPNYYTDENGNIILDEEGNPMEYSNYSIGFGDSDHFELYTATQEDIDAVWDIINHATSISVNNSEPLKIITEEAAAYFTGQKTVQEVADIIQSRVNIFVKESM